MPATIALVDDDQHLLTSVTMALEAEGFVVRPHSDPVKALQDLLSRPVDLAVLDIKMPQMDGLELLARLREHSSLPVVFLTSKDAEDDQLYGLSQGADDYITKPFSIRLLVGRIRAILRRAEPARSADGTRALDGAGCELVLDEDRHLCTWQGKALSLTVTEFLLLEGARPAPRPRQEPEPVDGCRLRRPDLRRGPHHRQSRQAHPQEVQGHRSGLFADRDALWCWLPIHHAVIRSKTI